MGIPKFKNTSVYVEVFFRYMRLTFLSKTAIITIMIERFNDQKLIRETLLHVRDLDAHARKTLGAESLDPYLTDFVYIDDDLSTTNVTYHDKPVFKHDIAKTALLNRGRRLMRLDGTIGHSALAERHDINTDVKSSLHLGHDLTYVDILTGLTSRDLPLSDYSMSLSTHEKLPEGDPRISFPDMGFDSYAKLAVEPSLDEQEAALHHVLSLTPDQLYVSETPKATPEQMREINAAVKYDITELFAGHNIDVRRHDKKEILRFKVGADDNYSVVNLRYVPFALAKYGNSYGPTGPTYANAVFSPTVIADLEYGGGDVSMLVSFHDIYKTEAVSLTARNADSESRDLAVINSRDEVAYVAKVVETLRENSTYGMLVDSPIGLDGYVIQDLENDMLPVLPEPKDLESVVAFVKKRT
jgi:hypothetical protein